MLPTSTHTIEAFGEEVETDSGEKPHALAVAPSAELAAAFEASAVFRKEARSARTRAAYESDWKRFKGWAAQHRARSLPASPETVASYLGWLGTEGYSVSTIERFLSAATVYHHAADFDFPRGARVVKSTLKGIKNNRAEEGLLPTKKTALPLELLTMAFERLIVEAATESERRVSLRRRAMLAVGWFCTLRGNNLVRIRRKDVRFARVGEKGRFFETSSGANGIIIHLPRSKTDQEGKGERVSAHAQPNELVCPVRLLESYFKETSFAPNDLIFPVNERTVSRLVKRIVANPDHRHKTMKQITECKECAENARLFASHSLRRGSATEFAANGSQERHIMKHGKWKNERIARGYMDDADLFINNPTKDLAKK